MDLWTMFKTNGLLIVQKRIWCLCRYKDVSHYLGEQNGSKRSSPRHKNNLPNVVVDLWVRKISQVVNKMPMGL
jgi:hypothetical protein